MAVVSILLLQAGIYAAFPFYFATLPYHLRSSAFYVYLAILYVFGGFLGSVYSLPISESIRISGGNLNYGAFMMTIILLVIIENDIDIVRHVLRLVITVNIFKLAFYSSLSWALTTEGVQNAFQTSANVFDISIPFVVLGGSLIVGELLLFLLVFSQVKRWINNIVILAVLYIAFYLLILLIDGVLFPLFAFATNPQLVEIIYGNVSGKIIMGGLYCIPMLAFLMIHRQRFAAFVAKPIDFSDLLKSSRRELQAALQDSERRYRLLVDTSPYAIAIYQHEKIVFVNEAACRLIGVEDYKDLIGQAFLSIVPDEQQNQSRDELQTILADKGKSRSIEQEILRADGKRIPVEISAVAISYQGHVAIQIIARDISERKQAETAAKEATRLQSELEKEREVSELKIKFTSMIVHDFRNPVAAIGLSADLIQRHAQEANIEKIQERANRISSTAKQLNEQIDDLLEMGKAESALINFSPKEQDMIAFCREIFLSFGQEQEDGKYEFVFLSEVEKQDYRFDNRLMEHVLDNLLANAVKYSPEGGRIELKLSKKEDSLEILVIDSGIGIPQEDLAQIFDFFHRASNASAIKGTGLGLAIVKQIVEKHGGTIDCQSEVNKGSRFTIKLPLGGID